MPDTLRNICIFSGSSSGTRPEYTRTASDLGQALVRRGLGLVYGGARVGLMGTLADAVLEAGGEAIGVMPDSLFAKEVGHTGLTKLHVVKTMHERKALMADLSDAFVALPGGFGTLDELFEALTWSQLGLHRKPCGLLNVEGYFDSLLSFVETTVAEGFVKREHGGMIRVSTTPDGILDELAAYEPPVVAKWINRAEV